MCDYQWNRSTFHLASAQEKLHASLLPFTNPSSFLLEKKLSPTQFSPIIVYTYPLVPLTPAFPLLVTAPAAIVPGQASNVDPYILSANNLAYTRTLELLRREIGPRFDLEKIWNEHIYYVYQCFPHWLRMDLLFTRNSRLEMHGVCCKNLNHLSTLNLLILAETMSTMARNISRYALKQAAYDYSLVRSKSHMSITFQP